MKPFLYFALFLALLVRCPAEDPLHAGMFTGDYQFQPPKGAVDCDELDSPLRVTASRSMIYPKELLATRYVGYLRGFAVLRADATVEQIVVTAGNNVLFRKTAQDFVDGWAFNAPLHHGHPVAVVVSFEFLVTEERVFGPYLSGRKNQPNQAAEPTPTSRGGSS